MKEICKLAQEKGFKAKTFSTQWAYNFYLGRGKDILITETVDYTLLAEIQKWLRDEKNTIIYPIRVAIYEPELGWGYEIITSEGENLDENMSYKSYEDALIAGIKETLGDDDK